MSLYDLLLNDVAIAELIGAFLDTGTEKYQDEELEIDNEEWDKKYEVDPDEIFDVFYGIWDTASDPKNFNELKNIIVFEEDKECISEICTLSDLFDYIFNNYMSGTELEDKLDKANYFRNVMNRNLNKKISPYDIVEAPDKTRIIVLSVDEEEQTYSGFEGATGKKVSGKLETVTKIGRLKEVPLGEEE